MSPENLDIPRHWRLRKQRYSLIGEICPEGHKIFPPRDLCPHCNREAKELFQFSGKGEIYSHSTVYDAPEGFQDQAPFVLAIVKLKEGPLITAQLTDFPSHLEARKVDGELREVKVYEVEIGMPVEMVTRLLKVNGADERGMLIYGYKFRPPVRSLAPVV